MLFGRKKKENQKQENVVTVPEEDIESINQQSFEKIIDDDYREPITVFEKKSEINPDLEVITGFAISEALINECVKKIDKLYYSINASIRTYIVNLVLTYPDLCYILLDKSKGEIIGYMYCFPMNNRGTVNFLLGNEDFEHMNETLFSPLHEEGLFNINIAEIAVLPEYKNNSTYQTLFNALIKDLTNLAHKGKFVNYMFMEISCVFERRIATALGFEYLTKTDIDRIMAGKVFDPTFFKNIESYPKFIEVYKNNEAKAVMANQQDYSKIFKK